MGAGAVRLGFQVVGGGYVGEARRCSGVAMQWGGGDVASIVGGQQAEPEEGNRDGWI
jgi:hypothetical protein